MRARSKEPTDGDGFLERAKRAVDRMSEKALADLVSKNPAAFMRLVEWRQAIEAAPPGAEGEGEAGVPPPGDDDAVMAWLRGLRDGEPEPTGERDEDEDAREAPPLPPAR